VDEKIGIAGTFVSLFPGLSAKSFAVNHELGSLQLKLEFANDKRSIIQALNKEEEDEDEYPPVRVRKVVPSNFLMMQNCLAAEPVPGESRQNRCFSDGMHMIEKNRKVSFKDPEEKSRRKSKVMNINSFNEGYF